MNTHLPVTLLAPIHPHRILVPSNTVHADGFGVLVNGAKRQAAWTGVWIFALWP
jgi:hypothetical protein